MNVDELANSLRNAYHNAPDRRKMTGIYLFAIRYANDIDSMKRSGTSVADLIKIAGIPSLTTEINDGMNIANYVDVKTDNLWF